MRIGELTSFVADFRARLTHFTVDDVRRRPILALYFVIGAMVVSYVIYLAVIIAKDLADAGKDQVPATTATEHIQEAPGAPGAGGGGANRPTRKAGQGPAQETPTQATTPPAEGGAQEQTGRAGPEGVDLRGWRVYNLSDRCQVSFPGTWQESKVPDERGVIHGIRLEIPGADASIQVYGRSREAGEDLIKTLRTTLTQKGAHNIEEKNKKINELNALELTGTVADKQMAITIFDHDAESYVVATLIANIKDYPQQRPYYDAVLGTYTTRQGDGISLRDLEQSIQRGLQKTEETLVGKMVELSLANGSIQKGLVVGEDETAYTLENYRFGGRYSFKVKKKDVVKISR